MLCIPLRCPCRSLYGVLLGIARTQWMKPIRISQILKNPMQRYLHSTATPKVYTAPRIINKARSVPHFQTNHFSFHSPFSIPFNQHFAQLFVQMSGKCSTSFSIYLPSLSIVIVKRIRNIFEGIDKDSIYLLKIFHTKITISILINIILIHK